MIASILIILLDGIGLFWILVASYRAIEEQSKIDA